MFFCVFLIVPFVGGVFGEVRYSIPEEMKQGSVIGNLARDLGLDVSELGKRKARVVAEGSKQYCELSTETGSLLVSERMDREELCAQAAVCVVQFQLLLENPLKVYSLILDVQDINDNSPVFTNREIELELVESTILGRRFPLESARDPDMGSNTIKNYRLSPNDHFVLEMNKQVNSNAYPELVLKKSLDRETQSDYYLTISGIDGGNPPRSGTASIHIHVLDANDNVPVFSQRIYKASVAENSPPGTLVTKINATDLDDGVYGEVTYSFSHVSDKTRGVVEIDGVTGEVRVIGLMDYEDVSVHELDVQAKDGGGQSSHSKLIIDVIDLNDNSPVISVKSASSSVPEDSPPGTMVALLNVYDLDTGSSGRVTCHISDNVPFRLVSEVKNYFMLVTDDVLDRETHAAFNITITAVDSGSPPLYSSKVIPITVSDVNDNAPVFSQELYTVTIPENKPQGTPVIRVAAQDKDFGSNAKIHYSLQLKDADPATAALLSINAETGEIFTSLPFDYETASHFQTVVRACDMGNPSLCSNCNVRVFVSDQNDNAPVILYPVQSSNFIAEDRVPLAAPKGYLVTKVVAVDADAGHNAWLSYRIIKATDTELFSVGLHCGEIRTLRQFYEDDEAKHTLEVLVEDNGPQALSATATVSIALGDSLPVVDEMSDFGEDESSSSVINGISQEDLVFYLIVALASVSGLLLLLITSVVYVKLCRRRSFYRGGRASNLPVFPPTYGGPPHYSDVSRWGTLDDDSRYNSFMTTGSWRGDFRFSSGSGGGGGSGVGSLGGGSSGGGGMGIMDYDSMNKRSLPLPKNDSLVRLTTTSSSSGASVKGHRSRPPLPRKL
ncbi:protocadherin beta-15 [Engraulis encrasicolus]|uniref:protocadherin beta-15 n=1 Tax=Engraulis encrasicolus TaxID=184585 RepID=UPI002FD65189